MLFNSLHFIAFFLVVTPVFYLLAHKFRWIWLLMASCYLYMAFIPEYILILGGTIVVDYFAAFWIARTEGRQRKLALATSIVANVGILAVFKYYNFMVDNIHGIFDIMGTQVDIPYFNMILPIGLSFHTFQAMSYTIEVYYGRQKPEKHFGLYSLYVMFYPQLVAGPIERPQNILPQFYEVKKINYKNVVSGLRLMAWGMFKKVVVADRIELITSQVFNHPEDHNNWAVIIGSILFTFQLYCDFSGYSDIAIGAARVMGYKLMLNFNLPFYATSVKEFWNKWHISLNTWFRDYVYFPMGGGRVAVPRQFFNIFVVFALSGLWHGSNWTLVLMGVINAFYIIVGYFTRPRIEKFLNALPIPYKQDVLTVYFRIMTFLCFAFSLIIFRSNSMHDLFLLLEGLTDWSDTTIHLKFDGYSGIWSAVLAILAMETMQYIYYRGWYHSWFFRQSFWVRVICYNILLLSIVSFGVFEVFPFYYFQF